MQSRLALRKILITHLISHCTSFAPGGAPVSVVNLFVCKSRERTFVASPHNIVFISVRGNAYDKDKE